MQFGHFANKGGGIKSPTGSRGTGADNQAYIGTELGKCQCGKMSSGYAQSTGETVPNPLEFQYMEWVLV